jgi:hypothetical protein
MISISLRIAVPTIAIIGFVIWLPLLSGQAEVSLANELSRLTAPIRFPSQLITITAFLLWSCGWIPPFPSNNK